MDNIVMEPSKQLIQSSQSNRPLIKVALLGAYKILKLTSRITWKITRIVCAMILMLLVFSVAMTQ